MNYKSTAQKDYETITDLTNRLIAKDQTIKVLRYKLDNLKLTLLDVLGKDGRGYSKICSCTYCKSIDLADLPDEDVLKLMEEK